MKNLTSLLLLFVSITVSADIIEVEIPGNGYQASDQFGGWSKSDVEMGYASIRNNRLQTYSLNQANSSVSTEENYINGIRPVTSLHNNYGCVISVFSMILEYYDRVQGFSDIPFSANPNGFTVSDIALMANNDYVNDYYLPEDLYGDIIPDKSEDSSYNRADSCIADVIKTSQSAFLCRATNTKTTMIVQYLPSWIKSLNSTYDLTVTPVYVSRAWGLEIGYDAAWEIYKAEIDAGRPVNMSINSRVATSDTDHGVVGFGYKVENGERFYACYNTWTDQVTYYPWADGAVGYAGGFWTFNLIRLQIKVAQASDFSADTLYRFRRDATGAYFFSANPQEVANVVNTLSKEWAYEGPVFKVETTENPAQSIVPVYRFYNSFAAAHFYTASESERDNVIANLSDVFHYEGVAFYAYAGQLPGTYPVYRFYLPQTRSHFFTLDEAEKQHIIDNVDPSYMVYEGVAWYGKPL